MIPEGEKVAEFCRGWDGSIHRWNAATYLNSSLWSWQLVAAADLLLTRGWHWLSSHTIVAVKTFQDIQVFHSISV